METTLQVLLAEADGDQRALLEERMRRAGHDVLSVPDGESAWRLLEIRSLPVLLVAAELPGVGGLELCRRVRAGRSGTRTTVLLLASPAEPEIVARALGAGADDVLFKPVRKQELDLRLELASRGVTNGDGAPGPSPRAIAHDFNNLLAGIMGYTSLALGEVHPDSNLRRYLRAIDTEVRRAADLALRLQSDRVVSGVAFSRRAPDAAEDADIVLVIDDEPAIRRLTTELLRSVGYRTLKAGDGQSGVDLFEARGAMVAAVILDMTMPGLSGVDTLRALRRLRPDVPVLVASGTSERELRRRFFGTAPNGFIQKPFRARELLLKLREVMRPVNASAAP